MTKSLRLALFAAIALLVPACGKGGDTIKVVSGNSTGQGGFGPGFGGSVKPDAVFIMTRNVPTIRELFAADAAGTTLVNLSGPLSGPLVEGGGVVISYWSPDRLWVAFIADKDVATRNELFVVPAAGGTPVKVCGPLLPGRDVGFAQWAPDSSRLAYIADDAVDNQLELFTVKPDGSGRIKVSGTLPVGATLDNFCMWAPDSSRIAFTGDAQTAGTRELFTVVPDGSLPPVRVSGTMVAGGNIAPITAPPYFWAPDGSRIVYRADQTTVGVIELYTSLPTGSASNVKVSGTMTAGGDVYEMVLWAPDSSRIGYLADQDTDGTLELYTTLPTGAGSVLKVSAALGVSDLITAYVWTPTSTRIAYVVIGAVSTPLYSADPVSAGSGVLVHTEAGYPGWSPDGGTLIFGGLGVSGSALFTSAPDGSGKVEIQPAGIEVGPDFNVSPTGTKIAYQGISAGGIRGVYTINPAGTGNVEMSASLGAKASSLFDFPNWMGDGSHVIYLSDAEVSGVKCLYSSTPSGSTVRISGPIVEIATISWILVR